MSSTMAVAAPGPVRRLYFGDNLEVLRNHVDDESVDLVYLDPPFNTGRRHALHGSARRGAGATAFSDRWRWDGPAASALDALREDPVATGVESLIDALRAARAPANVLSHLVMVAVRLLEIHRVMRSSGSLYLHCDAGASHYLKVTLDAIFDADNFRREIVWKSGWASGFKTATANWVRNHDVLLYYVKDRRAAFAFEKRLAYRPHADGYRRRGGGGNARGVALDDVWDEPALYSPGIKSFSREKLGYPTQKPLALLRRIVSVSSRPGDVVLDPCCGSGTAAAAAEDLGRGWIAIDAGRHAVDITLRRLRGLGVRDLRAIRVGAPGGTTSSGTRGRPRGGPAIAEPRSRAGS
jgi:site-specific DNA-methyltransferase (adenine-specific)